MPKFKKKPVVVEAVQYPCEHPALKRCTCDGVHGVCGHCGVDFIETLEGNMKVADGDWIITGVNGEHYPCKPDIFEKIYEPYSEETTGLAFGEALEAMKAGKRVSRDGWNGKGMFAFYTPEERIIPCPYEQAKDIFTRTTTVRAGLMLKTAQDDLARWAPSCSDCLAEDWEILP
ncbi:DUF2829 domain-containing protein [Shewanella algae]|uniref:DUF2829 domain-containing protein n=1 Tax=Shewanella algae TaxID=38313 RepID=UPI001F199BDB|nr:DUF2829 domain-containing protein [Shewanella algae]MCE9775596.1 DUF2829 domain-containing protein [Shewanella algae]